MRLSRFVYNISMTALLLASIINGIQIQAANNQNSKPARAMSPTKDTLPDDIRPYHESLAHSEQESEREQWQQQGRRWPINHLFSSLERLMAAVTESISFHHQTEIPWNRGSGNARLSVHRGRGLSQASQHSLSHIRHQSGRPGALLHNMWTPADRGTLFLGGKTYPRRSRVISETNRSTGGHPVHGSGHSIPASQMTRAPTENSKITQDAQTRVTSLENSEDDQYWGARTRTPFSASPTPDHPTAGGMLPHGQSNINRDVPLGKNFRQDPEGSTHQVGMDNGAYSTAATMLGTVTSKSMSVLDLGIDDMRVLADTLWKTRTSAYSERLEAAAKARDVQDKNFYRGLKHISMQSSECRRRNEIRDLERLQRLENGLRLTRPSEQDSAGNERTSRSKRRARGQQGSLTRVREHTPHSAMDEEETERNHLKKLSTTGAARKPVIGSHQPSRSSFERNGERSRPSPIIHSKRKHELLTQSLLGEYQKKKGSRSKGETPRVEQSHNKSPNAALEMAVSKDTLRMRHSKSKASTTTPGTKVATHRQQLQLQTSKRIDKTRPLVPSPGVATALMQSVAETLLSDASTSAASDSPEKQKVLNLDEEVETAYQQPVWSARGAEVDGNHPGSTQQPSGRRIVEAQGGRVSEFLPNRSTEKKVEQDRHSGFDQAASQFPNVEQSDGTILGHDIFDAPQKHPLNEDPAPPSKIQSNTTSGESAFGRENPTASARPEQTGSPGFGTIIDAEGGTETDVGQDAGMDFATELSTGLRSIAPESVGRWLLSLRGPGSASLRGTSGSTTYLEGYQKKEQNASYATGRAVTLMVAMENARSSAEHMGDSKKSPVKVYGDKRETFRRQLQFTSKKTLVDQATPARFEFVDNDHGMQFVNWRSFSGERVMERFWRNSVKESERRDQQRFEEEIQSRFAQEFEFERRKQRLWQAIGRESPDGDTTEGELAAQYYAAMQAALHGPKEDIITGQAFGRYIPSTAQSPITDLQNKVIYGPWALNWNRAITSRTTRVSLGGRRGAVSIGSSASSYVTTANVNWNRTAVTFAARPNDQAVKLGILRGRYGVDVARSNRLRTSAVETVMRYVETATVVDQINRTYGQRIRVRRFSFNYTRDFTIPRFDSPGRTPGLRQELAVNWGSLGISVGTDVPDNEYAISVGLRGYQFSVLRDFFQRLTQFQGNWGRGWQLEIATKFEDPINDLLYYQVGFGRLGRLYATAGAGFASDNTPMALVQVQGNDASVAFKAVQEAGVRVFNIGFTVGRFTYSWDSVVDYDRVAMPLSPISAILKTLLNVTP
uniref:Uncharacterized protein n=14 Tax=Toxoplasma gondii TaxID=5811 RepID=A0A0F7UUL9_TOXGV|nr:TPA: hypothetical protein BN1205_035620 [Toxoplasma gondii VEG]